MSTPLTAPGASTPVDEHHEERAHVLPPLKTFDTSNYSSSRAPASPTSPQNKSGFSKIGRTRSASRSSVTGIAANNTSQFVSLATAANGGDVTRTGVHVPPTYMPAAAGQDGLTRLPSSTSFRRVTSRPPIVSIMGSVSPPDEEDSEDDNHAFIAVRSREEAVARDERRNRARGYSDAIAPTPTTVATSAERKVQGRSRGSSDDSTLAEQVDPATGRKLGLDVGGAGLGVGPQGGLGGTAQNAKQVVDVEKGEAEVTVEKTDEEWMVRFEKGDPENPKNWSSLYRWYLTAAGSLLVLNSTFASSAPSGVVPNLERQFGFGREVGTLTISLFVAGYCCGPLLWGPASEQVGRKPVFLVAFLFYTGFQVGCALSQNTASILVFRFLGGMFASCPLTNSGALLADIWDADRRGIAMAYFSLAPFAGPALGPIVGGFIGASNASWRWLFWVLTLFAGFCGLIVLFTIPETYTPKILARKAKRLRKETGDDRYWAPLERNERDIKSLSKVLFIKPFQMLFTEPMLAAITVYMSFVYGWYVLPPFQPGTKIRALIAVYACSVYLMFEAYPIVFSVGHGFSAGITGLMFLGVFLGGVLSTFIYLVYFNPRYKVEARRYAPAPTPPEVRIEFCLMASPLLVIAFFVFGWTSYPTLSWVGPCIGGAILGAAVLAIFVSLFNYVSRAGVCSILLVLSTTVFRSWTPISSRLLQDLNPRWASTLLGFIALVMAPIPFVLIKYGPTLRARSKHAPDIGAGKK
ncbi:hypothetical protein QFC22_006049 [Naganishia vaughanmartiniae]|uniref:Uncharacterized protein n=1 Tax=Naganishia vaughanmartiniae TaxID=1424756 RepID=A0ACC2WPG3_9TREE|nr:hypothetical protein QFC22_006049 [Naganishia vaughanmartiniae]